MEPTVRDVMTQDVRTVPCNASLSDIEQILVDEHLSEVFVVDEEGFAVGVVPDYAVLKLHLADCTQPARLEAVMSRRFLVISPDSPLCVAARYLREHLHHRLAVVENRRLIGVVTRTSVLTRVIASSQPDDAAA